MQKLHEFLHLVGRILYGGFFVYNGLNHFLNLSMLAGYAQSKGVPMPQIAVIVSGLLMLAGGAMILLGWKVQLGAWCITLFLLPTSFIMHNFWTVADAQMRMMEMINFSKNMALMGAALIMLVSGAWPYAVEKKT